MVREESLSVVDVIVDVIVDVEVGVVSVVGVAGIFVDVKFTFPLFTLLSLGEGETGWRVTISHC